MGYVLIGLGGTGSNTVCQIKARLIEGSLNGTLPNDIVLRAVDTMTHAMQFANRKDELARMGAVPLDTAEYIWLGSKSANLRPIAAAVGQAQRRNGHTVAGTGDRAVLSAPWFQFDAFNRRLFPNNWQLNDGGSAQPQLVRLALLWDLQHRETSPVWKGLMGGLRAAGEDGHVSVYIIASTFGGTGTGLLFDIGRQLRLLCKNERSGIKTARITATLLLPEAFQKNLEDRAMARAKVRSYAFLRELRRLMDGEPRYNWFDDANTDDEPRLNGFHDNGEYDYKIFDRVYCVDGAVQVARGIRGEQLNQLAPEQSCTPLLVTAALAQIAPAGITGNFWLKNDQDNGASSFGVYSIELPLAQIIRANAWQIVGETCRQQAKLNGGRLITSRPGDSDIDSVITKFANREIDGSIPDPAQPAIDKHIKSQVVPLLQDILEYGLPHEDEQRKLSISRAVAAFEKRGLREWANHFSLKSNIEHNNLLLQWRNNSLGFIADYEGKSLVNFEKYRGLAADEVWRKLDNEVEGHLRRLLGPESEQVYEGGSFQNVLEQYRVTLAESLRRHLRVQSLLLLNAVDTKLGEPSQEQPRNGLGFVSGFLKRLSAMLLTYELALNESIGQHTRKDGEAYRAREAYKAVRKEGTQNPRPGLFGSGAEALRERLLRAAQKELDVQRVIQIERIVAAIVADFRANVEYLSRELDRWVDSLVRGKEKAPPMVDEAARHKRIEEMAAKSSNGPIVERIWDERYNSELRDRYAPGGLTTMLRQVIWQLPEASPDGCFGPLSIRHGGKDFPDAIDLAPALFTTAYNALSAAWERENILSFLSAAQNWRGDGEQYRPAEILRRLNGFSQVALDARGGTLRMTLTLPGEEDALDAQTKHYRDELDQAFMKLTSDLGRDRADIFSGRDKLRVTYIQWKDRIKFEDIGSFQRAHAYYKAVPVLADMKLQGREDDSPLETAHIMPQEVAAVRVEAARAELDIDPPLGRGTLATEVVQLLYDTNMVKEFAHAWNWQVIRQEPVDNDGQLLSTFQFRAARKEGSAEEVYWLTNGSDEFLQALRNWCFDRRNRHPRIQEGDLRGNITLLVREDVRKQGAAVRAHLLKERLKLQPMVPWKAGARERLAREKQIEATVRYTEYVYRKERIAELHALALDAKTNPAERDTLELLIVLLWEELDTLRKPLSTLLELA